MLYSLEIPPISFRRSLIHNAHILGHFQAQTTYERLKEKYYWKNMFDDVKKVVEACLTCIRHQKKLLVHQPAVAIEITKELFNRIGIDLVFGLPTTESGYKGIMVITEYLSKYPYAVPIRSKTAEEISSKLWMYITIFGPPKIIVSDQGKEFVNSIVKKITDGCGIEHRITSPYHPQANGMTERFNNTLVLMLKKHAEDDPHNWDLWLPYVLLAYRTRIHTATGFTPFELMFGRQMNNFDDFNTLDNDLDERMMEIKQMIEGTHPKVVERIKERQEKQTKY